MQNPTQNKIASQILRYYSWVKIIYLVNIQPKISKK